MRETTSAVVLVICLMAGGCAPNRFVDGVRYTAERYGVRSAATMEAAGRGYLRFDHALLSDLDDALAMDDERAMRQAAVTVLQDAHRRAVGAADGEIERMPPAGLDELVRRYHFSDAPTEAAARREFLKEQFVARSRAALAADVASVEQARSVDEIRRLLRNIRRAVEPPAGDRGKVARALLAAPLFLPATIGAEIADAEAVARETTADFERVILYEPEEAVGAARPANLAAAPVAVLAGWYAPVFVQQVNPEAHYAAEDDRIGRVYLTGTPERIGVRIDVSSPVVYWTHREAKIGPRRYDQFVYVAWYPRRPAMSENDPAAGEIDGVVVRITLDRYRRPAVYEFVRSCGCYHTLWVAEFVEAAARRDYGPPHEGQRYVVERPAGGRGLFLPELVRDDGTAPTRPATFVSAGYHLLMAVRPFRDDALPGEVLARKRYRLEPYENLTHLPLGDGVASMFGSDGLVHHAGRAEGWLLAPTGMLSAGQPRQLGTMKIRLDAYDYDDPRLLEQTLRLPRGF